MTCSGETACESHSICMSINVDFPLATGEQGITRWYFKDDVVLKRGLAERSKMLEAVPAEHARSWGWELVMRLDAER